MMALSCSLVSQKRPVSSLFAGREVKRRRCGASVQEAALRLMQQNLNVEQLLTEVSLQGCHVSTEPPLVPSSVSASLLLGELKCEAERRCVPVTTVTVSAIVQRLKQLTEDTQEILRPTTRDQLCVLLQSCQELLSQGALCPDLLWNQLRREEKFPTLEVVFHLHSYNIISLQHILESHTGRLWLEWQLKALCCLSPADETRPVQQRVLTWALQLLLGAGFDVEAVSTNKKLSALCVSVLDLMLVWFLETAEKSESPSPAATGAQTWVELLDSSLCGSLVSAEAFQRFLTHCLRTTLTHQPRLTVSSAISLQSDWTFAKTRPLLTKLFRQLTVASELQTLFSDLQHVLSTHEVNWRLVLGFLSTAVVYSRSAHAALSEVLDAMLRAAFQSYDLESLITAFVLARQAALEGPAVFSSYSHWFKRCFGGSSSPHAACKKAVVFLLKFLSDLVPFEPPRCLKVHILHPPFVLVKHRSLLLEYVTLAKTRLADLKESVEDMGLYEDVSAAQQSQHQETQDVEKALSLFESTGRISATVMEASIFRRPYFLTRFLPSLLTPRAIPAKADTRTQFIEALKKADKIPCAQLSAYEASCEKQKHRVSGPDHSPVHALRTQLSAIRDLLLSKDHTDLSAQLSLMSHSLGLLCPASSCASSSSSSSSSSEVVQLHTDRPPSELHLQAVDTVLRGFCQCVLDTCKQQTPTRPLSWTSRFVLALTENRAVFSCLVHRLWDLLHNQASSLAAAHVLGLAVFFVQLHSSSSHCPLVALHGAAPVCVTEALFSGLRWDCSSHMLFTLRFCLVAVGYVMCREDEALDRLIPTNMYKKLLFLVPRWVPLARSSVSSVSSARGESVESLPGSWTRATEEENSWRNTALSVWRNPAFSCLQLQPQFQLTFPEWLLYESQVCEGEDPLSAAERQTHQDWVYMELFLLKPQQEGGFGGDTGALCCRLLAAVLDNAVDNGNLYPRALLSDVVSRLQTCVYEEWLCASSHRPRLSRLVFELLSQSLSSSRTSESRTSESRTSESRTSESRTSESRTSESRTSESRTSESRTSESRTSESRTSESRTSESRTSESRSSESRTSESRTSESRTSESRTSESRTSESRSSSELVQQRTLQTWNRVMLALPVTFFLQAAAEDTGPQCDLLIAHINQHQRQRAVSSADCVLLCDITTHFLKGVLCACSHKHSRQEQNSDWFNKVWSQISSECPLLLVSFMFWWQHVSLCSLWTQFPRQFQSLSQCHLWAQSVVRGQVEPAPSAPPLQLAAALYRALTHCESPTDGFVSALRQEAGTEVLVFLFSLMLNRFLCSLLLPESDVGSAGPCAALLVELVDSPDWLNVFRPNESGVYRSLDLLLSEETQRLKPWAFYSLLCVTPQTSELWSRVLCCPGFIHTAVICYISLMRLYVDGHTTTHNQEPREEPRVEPSDLLLQSKKLLLRCLSQSSALSSSQSRQLQELCADVDPEVAAALRHLHSRSLSPDFL